MSQPVAYAPVTSFLTYQSTQPWFPGQNIDVELNNLKTTTDQIRANLALIQRDDGPLANGVVTYASLAQVLQTGGLSPLSAWVTGVAYTVFQTIISNNNIYQCAVAHTSGSFAVDLAAGKWTLLSALPVGPSNVLTIGTVTNGGVGVAAAAITGTSPAQVLNLTLPQGATGATGATGAQGNTGPAGATGVSGTPTINQLATFLNATTVQGVSITGLVKGNGVSAPAAATAGTDYLKGGTASDLNGAGYYQSTTFDNGTKTTGTFTFDPTLAGVQKVTNGGAHTFAPPAGKYGSWLIDYINSSAGALTTSGWTKVDGDAFDTTNAHVFRCMISVTDQGSYLSVKRMV